MNIEAKMSNSLTNSAPNAYMTAVMAAQSRARRSQYDMQARPPSVQSVLLRSSCVDLGRRDFQHASHDEGKRLNEYRRKGDAPHDAMRKMAFCDGNQKPQHR